MFLVIKIIRKSEIFFISFFIYLILFFFLIISPLIKIKFFFLNVNRIGSFISVNFRLQERKMNNLNFNHIDIYFYSNEDKHYNIQWLKLWKRKIFIIRQNVIFMNILKNIISNNKLFYNMQIKRAKLRFHKNKNEYFKKINYICQTKNVFINFNSQEEILGQNLLKDLGIEKNKFICIHARDDNFLKYLNSQVDWSYHNYRNSNIINYIKGIQKFSKQEYKIIRMGYKVKKLDTTTINNKNFFDYSNSNIRSDFNDIYLASKCRFFVCSDCGISSIPEIFNVPIIYTNWIEISSLYKQATIFKGIVIFKKFYSNIKKRFLTLNEICDIDFSNNYANTLKQNNITLIENTPEEIYEASYEMEQRLSNKWIENKENNNLQERFWKILGRDYILNKKLYVGSHYLSSNKFLLN